MVGSRVIIALALAALWSGSAPAADNRSSVKDGSAVNGLAITPSTPGASVRRFGSGALVERPGQPMQSVAPFGNGVIVSEPGKGDVVRTPFGGGTTCR